MPQRRRPAVMPETKQQRKGEKISMCALCGKLDVDQGVTWLSFVFSEYRFGDTVGYPTIWKVFNFLQVLKH
jgi:hypothetical protein